MQGYAADVPISTVHSGSEPVVFTSLFLGWEPRAVKAFVDPYQAKLDAIKAANPPTPTPAVALKSTPKPAAEKAAEPLPTAPPAKPLERGKGSVGSGAIFGEMFAEPGASYRFNYEDLKKPVDQLPKGVDPRNKEAYLRDEDFIKVLKSPREEFAKLKPWKQQALKKAAGLF